MSIELTLAALQGIVEGIERVLEEQKKPMNYREALAATKELLGNLIEVLEDEKAYADP